MTLKFCPERTKERNDYLKVDLLLKQRCPLHLPSTGKTKICEVKTTVSIIQFGHTCNTCEPKQRIFQMFLKVTKRQETENDVP